jgi:TRAP-type C4-dicarboxylate transport system substrate-binding protein
MRRNGVSFAFLVLLLSFFYSVGWSAEVIKLKYAGITPPTHHLTGLDMQFCNDIKTRTNGRVEVYYHPAGTLATAPKMFNAVVQGISDFGISNIAYTRGRFPLTEMHDLPLGFSSGYVATQVANDFYNKYKPKEWDSVHLLFLHGSGPSIVQTLNKPVKTLEDLKGLKLRGTARSAEIVKALGAVPLPLEMIDMYDALRRGVVDGNLGPADQLKGQKIGEVEKYITPSWKLGSVFTFYVVLNKDKWNSLPADVKKIINDLSAEYKEKYALRWSDIDIESRDWFLSKGGQVVPLSDAESVKWIQAVAPVITEYKRDMISKGYKETDLDSHIAYIKERIEYWRKAEGDRKIPRPYE